MDHLNGMLSLNIHKKSLAFISDMFHFQKSVERAENASSNHITDPDLKVCSFVGTSNYFLASYFFLIKL